MSETNVQPFGDIVASALVSQVEPAPAPVFSGTVSGFASVSSTSSGATLLTLGTDSHIAIDDRVIIVTPVTNVIGAVYCSVDQTIGDETKFTVLTNSDDGTNNSVSFYVTVMRKDVG